ncbi:MAG: hypothetical protein MST10_06800 [Lentisphaeria bacterium]|nr:hypothetical protein [Lentisphaeria bacterium]
MEYYLKRSGMKLGPFSETKFADMQSKNLVRPDDEVSADGVDFITYAQFSAGWAAKENPPPPPNEKFFNKTPDGSSILFTDVDYKPSEDLLKWCVWKDWSFFRVCLNGLFAPSVALRELHEAYGRVFWLPCAWSYLVLLLLFGHFIINFAGLFVTMAVVSLSALIFNQRQVEIRQGFCLGVMLMLYGNLAYWCGLYAIRNLSGISQLGGRPLTAQIIFVGMTAGAALLSLAGINSYLTTMNNYFEDFFDASAYKSIWLTSGCVCFIVGGVAVLALKFA